MQSTHEKSTQGLKQVKVDNWGTFFLQRLLQLYFNEELLDLTIKFHSSDKVLKVHRLVITTCTDYFLQLEREQNGNHSPHSEILMPVEMPYESVKSIISFMYTGQLEYWTSEQYALYHTAQKMNISILTKLLDAQMNANISQNINDASSILVTEPSIVNRKEFLKAPSQILAEKRSPNWKKKSNTHPLIIATKQLSNSSTHHIGYMSSLTENSEGPSRFDLPELEDLTLGVFSSFDDITYNTKPIIQAPEKTVIGNKSNKNISDTNITDTIVQFCDDLNYTKCQNQKDDSSDEDWIRSTESGSKHQNDLVPSVKRIKFNFDEKENIHKPINNCLISAPVTSNESVDNHAKIIREVLKKYPHLVQHNKNIRLKIMQKESRNTECSVPGKTKISYVVLKSDSLINSVNTSNTSENVKDYYLENNDGGPWRCNKCTLEEQYVNYYMYRRHMQDVHNEKFDPRICEHCGYKATKRNILMYHMYTKHNVSPPKSMSFPKCQVCSYIALSESLLIRHQINHKHTSSKSNLHRFFSDSVYCAECKKNFNDVTELACHEITSGHNSSSRNKDKGHYCLYCGKHFVRMTNLKVHVDCYHKNYKDSEYSQDMSNFMEPSLETDASCSVNEEKPASLNMEDESEIVDLNDKKPELRNTNFNNENKHIILSIGNKNSQSNNFKDFPLEIFRNDEIVIEDSDRNMIVYVQNTDNIESHQEINVQCKNTFENYEYLHNSDEIVEEVVEEFEAIEDEKQEHEFEGDDMQRLQIVQKTEKNVDQENLLNSTNLNENAIALGETIQYVEEETEILEYETCNTI